MLLFPFVSAPALAGPPPPIVRGTPTDDFPQVVMLRRATADWETVYICSGTLVAPDWVLTAAHCLTDPDQVGLTELRVFMGAVWTEGAPEKDVDIREIHPDYSVSDDGLSIRADMGMVHVMGPYSVAGYALNAQPVTEADIGTEYRYVGWGASGDTSYDAGYVKRYADIPLVGVEDEFMLGHDGDGGSAPCGGDSGGAVLEMSGAAGSRVASALAGVHSFGRDDDDTLCAGSTSGDTRVDLYIDWVASFTDVVTDAPPDPVVADAPADDDASAGCDSSGGAGLGLGLLAMTLLMRGGLPCPRS